MRPIAPTVALCLLSAGSAAAQTADFRVLAQFSYTTGISGDGGTIVGVRGGSEQVRWDVTGAGTTITLLNGEPRGVSFDGSVVAGDAFGVNGVARFQAYRETAGVVTGLGGFINPPGVENIWSSGFGLSDDGATAVGFARTDSAPPAPDGRTRIEAFRWRDGVLHKLGDLPGGIFGSVSRAANPDGTVIVGEGTSDLGGEATVWLSPAFSPVALPDLPGGDHSSQAFDVSDDGSVIVGGSSSANSGPSRNEACYWRDGQVFPIGDLPGSDFSSTARAVSGDGSVIVGGGYTDFTPAFGEFEAFYYTEAGGLRNLRTMLQTDYGVDLTGRILWDAVGISRDGLTICGEGLDEAEETTFVWWVRLPTPCRADFDGSGDAEVADIFAFLSAWFAQGPGSDFDGDAAVEVADIFAFLSAWFAGC